MQDVCRTSRLVAALVLRFVGDQWGSIATDLLLDPKHFIVVDKLNSLGAHDGNPPSLLDMIW